MISVQVSIILAVIFAVACFSVAITGFTSLGELADPKQRSDAVGFAWFWVFLGMIAVAFGAIGVWIAKTYREDEGG